MDNWEQVERLLYQLARRFYRRYGAERCARHGVTLEDLKQECYFAFLDAVRAYKPEKGYQLTTYLTRASEGRFRACMGLLRKTDPLDMADSLNEPLPEGGEAGDVIPDEQAAGELEAVDTHAAMEYYRQVLDAAMEALPSMQAAILRRRFYGGQTRPQIAKALRCTTGDVCREEQKALRALRGNIRIISLECLEGAAYRGTGWNAWYYDQASVEERIVDEMGPIMTK